MEHTTSSKNILITGGSGFIGRRIADLCRGNGHALSFLTTNIERETTEPLFYWNVKENYIDTHSTENKDIVIHLPGAGIAERYWTADRKKEIWESRVLTTRMLYDTLKNQKSLLPECLIAVSAIGYYGANTGDTWLEENTKSGDDFLAKVVFEWEAEVQKISLLGIRTVILRLGVVLGKDGGFLQKMLFLLQKGMISVIGNGNQYISWIDREDLVRLLYQASQEKKWNGIFNAVSPNPVSNKYFTYALARCFHKKIYLPAVPSFVLKLIYGEMAQIITGGNRASSQKIESMGFVFDCKTIEECLSLHSRTLQK
ncbi:MAG: TIGR01777 family oxidoreductase [Chitinophagaceae bacterium]|nr:TIGR01777 family oxidoreductase [Chitinophagaceae bacterium]